MTTSWIAYALAGLALVSAAALREIDMDTLKQQEASGSPKRPDKVIRTDEEWQKRLTPEQYRILRKKGTEAAFCSPLYDHKKEGSYFCVGCELELFRSDAKFQSGTGWPSFFQPAAKDAIWTQTDRAYGMIRTEVLCARCDGHLGHVFNDAPKTATGLRYCINGEVLRFVPND